MKNIRLYSLIIVFLLILVSCGNGQTKKQRNKFKNSTASYSNEKDSILYLDLKAATEKKVDVNLSEICDSVIYIPLQINKNCLIDSRGRILKDKNDLFYFYSFGVYHFGINGNYLGQIGRIGRGPGELMCTGGAIDEINKRIFLTSNYRNKQFIYDYSGRFISSTKRSQVNSNFKNYLYHNNKLIYNCINHLVIDSHYYDPYNRIAEYDLKTKAIKKIKSNYFPKKSGCLKVQSGSYSSGLNSLYKYNNKIMFQEFSNDTLYEYKKGKLIPRIILNNYLFRNRFKIPKELQSYDFRTKINEIRKLKKKNSYSMCKSESSRYISLSSYDGLKYLYNKKSKTLQCVNKIVQDMNCFKSPKLTKILEGKYYYSIISPEDFIEKANKSIKSDKYSSKFKARIRFILKNLNEESNPIIVLYRIRY
ncbi:6-bladed beta-propeller [Marinilabiliaceae bacterium JC040]|nr:6-bladed beta-propeller [Marinilabiliaceae bacterium JC040]